MSRVKPDQVIDLTGMEDRGRFVEIVTDAGTVRVNAGLIDMRTGGRVVTVEIEAASPAYPQHKGDGDWDVAVRRHDPAAHRAEIALRRLP